GYPFAPGSTTLAAWTATRFSIPSTLPPRPAGSSTIRTARRATGAASGSSRPDGAAGDRPVSDSLDVRATEEPPRTDEQRRDQHQVRRDVAEPAPDDRIQIARHQ